MILAQPNQLPDRRLALFTIPLRHPKGDENHAATPTSPNHSPKHVSPYPSPSTHPPTRRERPHRPDCPLRSPPPVPHGHSPRPNTLLYPAATEPAHHRRHASSPSRSRSCPHICKSLTNPAARHHQRPCTDTRLGEPLGGVHEPKVADG